MALLGRAFGVKRQLIKDIFMKRQLALFLSVVLGFVLTLHPVAAFTNNRYLAYGKKSQILQVIKPPVLAMAAVNKDYITSLVKDDVDEIVAQGLLKGPKGDPAIFPTMDSVDPNSSDFQQAYVPVAVSGANQQTFFAATNLSGDNISTNSVNTTDFDSTGSFTNEGSAAFSGNTSFAASTTMADLNVATIESPVSGASFDGYSWTDASSRDLKENFATITPADILAKIASLPIYTWNYKTQNASSTHMGPVAEDFYSAFSLGNSSSSISTIDPAGVALAGIQGLDAKVSSLMDISWILDGLKALGADIEQGIIKVESLIAQTIQTGQLQVGSADQPTGITIYDTVTKQPVCIFSANNILQSLPGKCQDVISATQSQPAPIPVQASQGNNATTAIGELPSVFDISSSISPTIDPSSATALPVLPITAPDASTSSPSTLTNLTTND